MHNKLQKYVDRALRHPGRLRIHAILISDSKGNYLRKHHDLISQFGYQIEFQCHGGARFYEYFYWLQKNLVNRVRICGQVVLYIFLGTCELTLKRAKFIDLKHEKDENAVSYVQYQIQRCLNYVSNFPTVSIVFLQIPPYSIQAWNSSRGHRDPSSFSFQRSDSV